jgi:hypothetical protein
MVSIRATTVISESDTQLTPFDDQGTLPCIESEHFRLLTYNKCEVVSPLTPSTSESHFSYDIARHPNYTSLFDFAT